MEAHQAPLSLGFCRQEHWSGLPFPSPMHESEKWKGSRSVVSNSATLWTAAHQAPPSMGFSRQEYWSGVPLPSPSVSPRPVQLLHSSPAGLQSQMFWAPPPDDRPQAGEPDIGLRTFNLVGKPLQSNYFPVCGLPPNRYRIWLYCKSDHPTVLLDVGYLWI